MCTHILLVGIYTEYYKNGVTDKLAKQRQKATKFRSFNCCN